MEFGAVETGREEGMACAGHWWSILVLCARREWERGRRGEKREKQVMWDARFAGINMKCELEGECRGIWFHVDRFVSGCLEIWKCGKRKNRGFLEAEKSRQKIDTGVGTWGRRKEVGWATIHQLEWVGPKCGPKPSILSFLFYFSEPQAYPLGLV